ncbi:MAG: DNA repair protein RecO [Pelagibacteraceae bacterium]|nr:MAG: DNA repair protein RecO [Pelagibacteraceae bacterium]
MHWQDIGFLISKNRYNENSIIAEFFTKDHGKISGIIFGATSKKIKNYLQIGNKLHINYSSKNNLKIGYLKIEIIEVHTPLYFDYNQKLFCIISAMHLIKILTAEFQKNNTIYELLENLFLFLNLNSWLKNYIYWELELYKALGYDLKLDNFVQKSIFQNQTQYFSVSSAGKKTVPNFLIEKNIEVVDLKILLSGLKLVSDFLEKTILKPNNLNYPFSRLLFISSLK